MKTLQDNLRFRVGYWIDSDCLAVLVGLADENGWLAEVAKPVEFVKRDRSQIEAVEPTFQIDPVAAKSLMDALWNYGIRPTNVGTAGQLAATERHLADLRCIAFHKIGVKADG